MKQCQSHFLLDAHHLLSENTGVTVEPRTQLCRSDLFFPQPRAENDVVVISADTTPNVVKHQQMGFPTVAAAFKGS